MGRLISSPTSVWSAFWQGATAASIPTFIVLLFRIGAMQPTGSELADFGLIVVGGALLAGLLCGLCCAVPVLLKNWLYRRIQNIPSDHQAMK